MKTMKMPGPLIHLQLIAMFLMLPCQVSGAEDWFEQGLSDLRTHHYEKAIGAFTKAIAENPHRAKVYNNRGIAWCNEGNYDQAMSDFNKALELDPRSAEIFSNRGIIWFYMGKYDLAIDDYDKALGIDPHCSKAYTNRGAAWFCKGNYDLAIFDYNKALEIDPNCVETNRQLAWISGATSGSPDKKDSNTLKKKQEKPQVKPKTGPPPILYVPFAGEGKPKGPQNGHRETPILPPETEAVVEKPEGHIVPPIANKKSNPRQPALPERKTEVSLAKPVAKTVYSVQIGAYVSRTNADELMNLMKDKGYEARLLPFLNGKKEVLYTVSIGEFTDRQEAKKKAGEFTEKEKRPSFVRPFNEL
jgi:tetratricopeptide (TPR) repeat protein